MSRLRGLGAHLAFIWDRNLFRLLIVLAILAALVAANGTIQVLQMGLGVLGSAPAFALQLSFAAFYLIVQFGFLFWFLSRPRKYVVTPDDPQIGLSFADYRGQPDLLEHAQTTVSILRGVKEFELRGGEMPRGMLLSGSPGTGKTFLAAVIANEAKLPFIYIDASSIRGMFWGMTEMMIMKLFRDARGLARKYAPEGQRGACIVFMDEIDSIGMNRGGQQSGGMMMGGMMMGGSQGLNTLLNQMDSLANLVEDRWRYKILRWLGIIRGPVLDKPLVFVIGATNRPEVLDPALTRPGRLDRMLVVHEPDADGRRDIILHYLAQKRHDPDLPIDLLVTDSMGWTPIMIKTIINEALIHAHHDGREFLTYKDWLDAADERSLGLKQPIRSWNLNDRRETAYHEAGHAVAARYLRPDYRISKATIIRRGHALGFVQQKPLEERTSMYARWIETQIMVSLAGHVIEDRFLDTLTTGPSSDLVSATWAARQYVGRFAMGPTKVILNQNMNEPPIAPVLVAAHELLDQLYVETERLLREKEAAVHHLAKALIERHELIGDELEEVFREVETAHPELREPFERKVLQFRDFAPLPQQPALEGWTPPTPPGDVIEQPAASEPVGWTPPRAGGELPLGWSPPPPGGPRTGPGMPTDVPGPGCSGGGPAVSGRLGSASAAGQPRSGLERDLRVERRLPLDVGRLEAELGAADRIDPAQPLAARGPLESALVGLGDGHDATRRVHRRPVVPVGDPIERDPPRREPEEGAVGGRAGDPHEPAVLVGQHDLRAVALVETPWGGDPIHDQWRSAIDDDRRRAGGVAGQGRRLGELLPVLGIHRVPQQVLAAAADQGDRDRQPQDERRPPPHGG
jgi:cell division protease FtsH